jgi:predicted SAM-dependent methyltransferase
MTAPASKLHLGCGENVVEGWINVDGSWNARLAKHPYLRKAVRILPILPKRQFDIPWSPNIFIHDVRKSLPFQDSTFTAIYASHLLEHLYLDEGQRLLGECFRVLSPGGVLRMVVPDLRALVLEYVSSDQPRQRDRADILVRRLLLRDPHSPKGNLLYRLYNSLLDFHSHKWMYDAQSLTMRFTEAGLVDVEEKQLNESRISGIASIEKPDRVLDGEGICVEGIKPH